VLRTAGYEVGEARNGTEGIVLFRESPFDLVITDLLMPEKDGLEVMMELRKDFPQLKVITLSGGGEYGYSSLRAAKSLGAARTLKKPIKQEELLTAIREVFS
jgi:YesN/AraC family two-component response regulator